jgi:NTE family protein
MKHFFRTLGAYLMVFACIAAAGGNSYKPGFKLTWEEFSKEERPKTGLALGGGAVLGAAHIGVLKALDELNITIDCIAGTSIGAFVSAFYAFGFTWQDIEEISEDIAWGDLSGISFSNMGLLSNSKMGDLIREYIGQVDLKDAVLPTAMIAADINSMEKIVLTRGDVSMAVMASTCIPGVFVPVEIDGRMLIDGGVVENVPVSPLREMGAELIIAVDLSSRHSKHPPENLIEILMRSFMMMSHTVTGYQLKDADIIISPDLSEFNVVDIDQSPELIRIGYQEAMKVLSEYFKP